MVSLDAKLNVAEQVDGQVAREESLHALVHKLKHCLQALIDLLREVKQGGLVFLGQLHAQTDTLLTTFGALLMPMLLFDQLIFQNAIYFMRDLLPVSHRENFLSEYLQAFVQHTEGQLV